MADYQWPQADNRSLIGKRISRVDGPLKSSGRATYTYDVQRPGLLFGKMVLSPHAHARIVSIDTSSAERMPGVQTVDVIRDAGQEVLWVGQEILAVAAETEEQARDAARAVKITYEKLPHLVSDVEPAQAGDRAEVLAEAGVHGRNVRRARPGRARPRRARNSGQRSRPCARPQGPFLRHLVA